MATQVPTFAITGTKLCVPVITLFYKKLKQKIYKKLTLQINFTKNWNQVSIGRPNQYLDYLIDPSFQRVDRLFVLSFENNDLRTSFKQYFLPYVDYDVMINERNFWSTLKII